MAKPSTTNCPRLSFVSHSFSCIVCCRAMKIDTLTKRYILFYSCFACEDLSTPLSGGYSGRVPPLPIPNREVKPACADGTTMQCGRVGSCLFYFMPPVSQPMLEAFLCFIGCRDIGWCGVGAYAMLSPMVLRCGLLRKGAYCGKMRDCEDVYT